MKKLLISAICYSIPYIELKRTNGGRIAGEGPVIPRERVEHIQRDFHFGDLTNFEVGFGLNAWLALKLAISYN